MLQMITLIVNQASLKLADKIYYGELEPGVIDSALDTLNNGEFVQYDPEGMYVFMNNQFGWW